MELRHLRDLNADELVEAYAPPRLPWFRVNFVSTVDGAAQGSDGLSGGINNAADKRAYDALRARADAVVVGAGTARAEAYGVPEVPIVVVTRSGVVPTKLLGAPAGAVLLATVATSPGLAAAREELGADNVLVCGEDRVDLAALAEQLSARGLAEVLCEGGPSLFADALAAGVVDEVCVSLVPRLVAGSRKRITDGPDVEAALDLTLLLEDEGTLLGRWLVRR